MATKPRAMKSRETKPRATKSRAKRELPESVQRLGTVLPIEPRAMFGGYGIYSEGVFFALLSSQGVLYFRVSDANRPDFEKAGSEPFMPYSRVKSRAGERIVMPYYEVPEQVLAKPATLRRWAEKAVAAALEKRKMRATRAKRSAGPRPGVR
jgi:DNA transformation protein